MVALKVSAGSSVEVSRCPSTSKVRSCAIALDECHRTGVIKPGNHVLIVAFGAGFTWAASVVKW